MDDWMHPLQLELKHDEKIIGGKATKRQGIILLIVVILVWLSFQIPVASILKLVKIPNAHLVGVGICAVIGLIWVIIGAIFAFVPAYKVTFFDNPKPKANLDPYDVNMTIDGYLWFKFVNSGKKPILPYRIIK